MKQVARGIGSEIVQTINLTRPHVRRDPLPAVQGDAMIIGMPVYEEWIPAVVLPILKTLRGSGQPVILVAVYGNVGEGIALRELDELCRQVGFCPVGAASFIAEHSFSTTWMPIAKGRPDDRDLKKAEEFGQKM